MLCLPNARDQLRSAHDLTLVHDERSDEGATTRLQPRFVSCIALLGGAVDPGLGLRPALSWAFDYVV